ncbi:MAG TPA: hypothetical protein PLN27_15585 [Acidobacteriota bacterium]|nr:hypothetical protein [Acidobacteriota bacterium]
MWKCKKCGFENEDEVSICWNCEIDEPTTPPEQITQERLHHQKERIHQQESHKAGYTPQYRASRLIARVISFLGWLVFVVCLILLIKEMLNQSPLSPFFTGGCILGLLLVVQGQLTRANVDIADSCNEILRLLKRKQDKRE